MMMMNSFRGMIDQQKAFTPYFQPRPLSEFFTITISDTPRAGFEPAQNLSSEPSLRWLCKDYLQNIGYI